MAGISGISALSVLPFGAIHAMAAAPTDATYVLMTAHAMLPQRRILTPGAGISIADGGATNPVTVSVNGDIQNASYVLLGANPTFPNERILAGTANRIVVTDGGAGGAVTLSPGALIVQTDQGNTFTTGVQQIETGGINNQALILKMAAGQVENAFEVQDSVGAAQTVVDANGNLIFDLVDSITEPPIYIGGALVPAGVNSRWIYSFEDVNGVPRQLIGLSNDVNVYTLLNITSAAGAQFRWVKGADVGNTVAILDSDGNFGVSANLGAGIQTPVTEVDIRGLDRTAFRAPVHISGAYTPVGTNSRWPFLFGDHNDASGAPSRVLIGLSDDASVDTLLNLTTIAGSKFRFVKGGSISNTLVVVDSNARVGINQASPGAQLQINCSGAAIKGQIIKGAAVQAAALLQLQDSIGGVVVDSGNGLAGSEFAFNQGGIDIDFRVESLTYDAIIVDAGTDALKLMNNAAGLIGFFGAAPVNQRQKANYNNWAAFTDVVDALVDLGLFDAA